MPTRCFVTFPATGVKAGVDNILHSVANFIIGKFPQRTIRAVNVDTKDKMRDFYKNALLGYANKTNANAEGIQELVKIPKPHMFIGYTFDNGLETADTGFGETPTWAYPSAHYLDENLNNALPMLEDNDRGGILLATYNLRIRVTAEFLINCNSKEEQLSIALYLKNFIRDLYSHVIRGVKTQYVLPNSLIDYLKDRLYGEVPYENVSKEMDEYLKKYSKGAITPVYKNGKVDDKYYAMEYEYKQIDFKISGKAALDDGEKKDQAYDNYTIRFPAVVEFYIPSTYVIRTPSMVINNGGVHTTPDAIDMDTHPTANVSAQVLKISKKYHDLAVRNHIPDDFVLVARDEFALADSEDYYDIRFIMRENDMLVFNALTPEQRKECYKVLLFEDERLLDEGKYYDMTPDWVFNIHKGDVTKHQMIEIYLNVELARSYIELNRK